METVKSVSAGDVRIASELPRSAPPLPILADPRFLRVRGAEIGWLTDGVWLLPFYVNRAAACRRLTFTTAPIALQEVDDPASEQTFVANAAKRELGRAGVTPSGCDQGARRISATSGPIFSASGSSRSRSNP